MGLDAILALIIAVIVIALFVFVGAVVAVAALVILAVAWLIRFLTTGETDPETAMIVFESLPL
jgi:hypothetical protein